jgi:response regulator RpfG family c-di-GMP phosphodiesterase/signal transduction histidine kinase
MPSLDKVFEERLGKEYDLGGRTRLVIILSAVLYLCFLFLDSIHAGRYFRMFLAIRLTVIAAHAVLLLLLPRVKSNRGYLNIAIALTVFDVAGIAIMIQFLGGFATKYVQGLYLIIMGMVAVVPLAFRATIILYVMIWASYAIPGFVNRQKSGGDWRDLFTNLFFLTAMVFLGFAGSFIMERIRRRELKSRIRLEELTEALKESNFKLQSLDKLKTQFFSNVSHELRTPLTLMLVPLAPMLDKKMGPISAKQKETIESVRHNGIKLLKLINNLLDLAKLEEGKMRLKVKTVDFIEYTGAFLATIKPLADRKRIKLFHQHPPHKVDLVIDPDQFEKVIMNLLSNAVKFTPESGRITIYIEETEASVILTVEDTGKGIPEDMLVSIFDRFSQVDGSLSRSHEGTGIGLSLAMEITLLHRGRIHAESKLNQGSRFIVELRKGDAHFGEDVLDRRTTDQPVVLRKRATDLEEPRVQDIITNFRDLQLADLEKIDFLDDNAGKERKHDYHLLVLDDNPEVLKLMKLLLENEFDLTFSTSASEGLVLLREQSPDLVLCDLMMPGMDGQQFCRAVKGDDVLKHTPVILVTARSGSDLMAEGIESGADDYVTKPFSGTELKARIQALLRIRSVEAELSLANRNLKMRTNDLVERQKTLFIAMVKSLVSALDAKDIYTRHHSTRVTEYTLKIAGKMNFGVREMADLELAALLHDVGKIGVPEYVLNKKARLTEEEMGLIRQHPVHAESILKPVVELNQISKIVRAHHERYDGTGYPDRLRGLEIPLAARIMAVADTYDAITSERPYRGAESHSFAVKEIIKFSGVQFDPEVVQHFIEIAGEIAKDRKPDNGFVI